MQMKRIIFFGLVGIAAAGVFWWLADWRAQTGQEGSVEVHAGPAASDPGPVPIGAGTPASAQMERQILEAIGQPGTRIRGVRVVDVKRKIACGERLDKGSAIPRRFVWLSQLRQLVTDDGGQDFAILVHVCTPPPSP